MLFVPRSKLVGFALTEAVKLVYPPRKNADKKQTKSPVA
jgi:hypothetical protein